MYVFLAFVVCCLMCIVRSVLFVVRCVLFVCLLFVVSWPLCVVRCVLFVVCCVLLVVRC